MNKNICNLLALIPLALVSMSTTAQAQQILSCTQSGTTFTTTLFEETTPALASGAFRQYGNNCPSLASHWSKFGMEKSYWNEGWGFDDACNIMLPLNRALRALEAVKVSATPSGNGLFTWMMGEFSPPTNEFVYLQAAYERIDTASDHIRAGCARVKDSEPTGDVQAYFHTSDHLLEVNKVRTITLFLSYFQADIVDASGMLVHEATHRWKSHNGKSKCGSCDSEWNYNGANTHEAAWNWSYSQTATHTQPFLRTRALDLAKWIGDNRFVVNPGFRWPTEVPALPSGW